MGIVKEAIQGGLGLVKGVVGLSQTAKANKALKNFKFPTYTTPTEITDLLTMAKQRANVQELPGQSLIENKLGAQTAYGMRAAEKYAPTGAAALEAATGLYGKQMGAVRDLGIQFANFKAQRESELGAAQQIMAGYKDKEFETNKWDPAQVKYNQLQSQKQAGAANLWGGIQDVASMNWGSMFGQNNNGLSFGQKQAAGIQTTPQQSAWLQGNANQAQIPNMFNR